MRKAPLKPASPNPETVRQAQALNEAALERIGSGKQAEAMSLLSRAVSLNSGLSAPLSNLGALMGQIGKDDDALLLMSHAAQMQDCTPDVLHNLGILQRKSGKLTQAITTQKRLLKMSPDHLGAVTHLASMYLEIGNLEAAKAQCESALVRHKDDGVLKMILARIQILSGDTSAIALSREAIQDLENGQQSKATDQDAQYRLWCSHGDNLIRVLALDEAKQAFEVALGHAPNSFEIKAKLAELALALGNLVEGWEAMEVRWQTGRVSRPIAPHHDVEAHESGQAQDDERIWRGQPLAGKSLLVYTEQGLGDTFMYARHLPQLRAMGAKVTLIPQYQLVELLSHSDLPAEIMAEGENLSFHYHCSIMDLPLYCGVRCSEDIVAARPKMPWLRADQGRRRMWDQKLQGWFGDSPRIAIAWSGNPKYLDDSERSIPLSCFGPILKDHKVVSVQKVHGLDQIEKLPAKQRDNVLDVSEMIEPGTQAFTDTAAILANCDLVICSDSSVAHLAGAMGVQTALALHYSPEWRWSEALTQDPTQTPWYADVRLHRQPKPSDWASVFEEIKQTYPYLRDRA